MLLQRAKIPAHRKIFRLLLHVHFSPVIALQKSKNRHTATVKPVAESKKHTRPCDSYAHG
jgi:hypothetical protein